MKNRTIVESSVEPSKENIWLHDGKLEYFSSKGWTPLVNPIIDDNDNDNDNNGNVGDNNNESIEELKTEISSLKEQLREITNENIKFANFIASKVSYGPNLYNKGTVTRGKVINSIVSSNTIYDIVNNVLYPGKCAVSDFIPVEANTNYVVKFGTLASDRVIAFYDKNKKALHTGYTFLYSGANPAYISTDTNTAYIVLSFGNIREVTTDKMINETVVVKGEILPSDASYLTLDNYIRKSKLNLKEIVGKNLFDASKIINGYFISTAGVVTGNSNSAVSSLIPIKANKVYSIHREITTNAVVFGVRFVASNGTTSLPPLDESGNTIDYYQTKSVVVKAPSNAAFLQCTVNFFNNKVDYNTVQIEEGNTFTGYEPYQTHYVVNYPSLPVDLEALDDRVRIIESKISNMAI